MGQEGAAVCVSACVTSVESVYEVCNSLPQLRTTWCALFRVHQKGHLQNIWRLQDDAEIRMKV